MYGLVRCSVGNYNSASTSVRRQFDGNSTRSDCESTSNDSKMASMGVERSQIALVTTAHAATNADLVRRDYGVSE